MALSDFAPSSSLSSSATRVHVMRVITVPTQEQKKIASIGVHDN